ncbi:MAG: dihydroxy-acid dehydratase [Actinomycetes bacterium]
MSPVLRSNLPVGSPRWATRRAQWRSLGLSVEDLEKPKIAVVNSSSDLAPCFSHLDGICGPVKQAIRDAGGVGFEIRTTAPTDFIMSAGRRGGYVLSSRELVAHDIEAAVEGAQLDGMVCLASCDKTTPGHLMAAARLNVPTVVVACGYQQTGVFRGEECDIEEVFLQAGHLSSGGVTLDDLSAMCDCAIASPGVCAGMGTANSMHCAAEALGMTLPGSTPVRANSPAMWDVVADAGRAAVEAVLADRRPRDVLTPAAFGNAVKAVLSVSGSINTVKHLQAVAVEAEAGVDVYGLFERYADDVPLLAGVRPNGRHSIEDFERAGGTQALLKRLEPYLDTGVTDVRGTGLGDTLRTAEVRDDEVIRPVEDAFAYRPGIVLVRGSLAPETGIVKLAVDDDRPTTFAGPAVVYEALDTAMTAVKAGEVRPGDVVVLRGLGPRGTPGMGMASQLVFALDGAGLSGQVAVVTDGQLSGLVNKGIVVGEVQPEAADAGPIAVVRDGDKISVDLTTRTVHLDVPEQDVRARLAAVEAAPGPAQPGWLSLYARSVQPLTSGAVLSREP